VAKTHSKLKARSAVPDDVRPSSEMIYLEPGPRKMRKPGPPQPRLSNHKIRSIWFQARDTWPFREAPVRSLINERRRAKRTLNDSSAEWEIAGPTNIGGRMTSIVGHPANPDVIWAGSAAGGVWMSRNGGKTWTSQWHSQEVMNVGSLAIDPNNADRIYCGTGEANLSSDSYPGVGVYQTEDAGKTWRLLADAEETGIPTRIGVIAIDPFNPKHVRIGGVGSDETSPRKDDFGGMYVSEDSGVSWRRETFISEDNYWCHAIVFHPRKRGIIFSTFTERGAGSGIWRSINGGRSWNHLEEGLPESPRFGRTSIAISPSNPAIIYAFATDEASDRRDLLLGVFRSENGGDTWTRISGVHFRDENQISYGNAIVVHPQKPNLVICGGVDLHVTTNAGKSWVRATQWDATRGSSHYAHADHHALLMPAKAPGRVYSMNDGGMDVSGDAGAHWSNRSNGLAVTMYYDMDVAQSDGRNYGGGAQDNGSLVTIDGRKDHHFEILGGDGGWLVYDPDDPRHLYASYYNMGIFRFRAGRSRDVSPHVPESGDIWMCCIVFDPSDSKWVYTGSTRLWRTRNDGLRWNAISPHLDDSAVTAIEVAPADPRRIYVGTENGGIFRSTDRGRTWSPDISGATLPGKMITRLDSVESLGADVLFATVAGFGHSHVFRSEDGGLHWTDADRGQLPNVPHSAVLIRPDDSRTVYVANDAGVFVSHDGAKTWNNMSGNLPNVMVIDLVYQTEDKRLSAATYGRSLWRAKV
jgi:photosystem II stability/assembly factor-like uncharacterized protein